MKTDIRFKYTVLANPPQSKSLLLRLQIASILGTMLVVYLSTGVSTKHGLLSSTTSIATVPAISPSQENLTPCASLLPTVTGGSIRLISQAIQGLFYWERGKPRRRLLPRVSTATILACSQAILAMRAATKGRNHRSTKRNKMRSYWPLML